MSLLSVPLRTILPFWAQGPNQTLPHQYEYCDGRTLAIGTHDIEGGLATYTLPNLINRYLVGADRTKAPGTAMGSTDDEAAAPGPDAIGGINGITLTLNEIPTHGHTGSADSQGGHSHVVSTSPGGGHNHGNGDYAFTDGSTHGVQPSGGFTKITCTTFSTSGAGSHYHTLGGSGSADSTHYAAHVLQIGNARNSSAFATGSAIDNRPRSTGIVWIIKVRN